MLKCIKQNGRMNNEEEKNVKLVFLDKKTIGDNVDFSEFDTLGEVTSYDFSIPEEIPERVRDADVIIVNMVPVNAYTVRTAAKLKLVCVAATGTDNLDKEYLSGRGIAWRNVAGYSSDSVAQHTLAMLLYLMEHLRYYDDYVRSGQYIGDYMFTHMSKGFHRIAGRTWGIIGLGAIGRRVAEIARAFGAEIIYCSVSGAPEQDGYLQVPLETLLCESDIISVHVPLNTHTVGLIDAEEFRLMKSDAVFLNLSRGAVVVEKALADALNTGEIAAAGLDVIQEEPMSAFSPLLDVADKNKLLITPHIGWASVETRMDLLRIVAGQIRSFFALG